MTDQISLSPREMQLLEALRSVGGHARNAELAGFLDVSEETIRRTVKSLSKLGLIARAHGAARLLGSQYDANYFQRLGEHVSEKRRIAEAATALIPDGAFLFLDVGSTTAFVAEELRDKSNLKIVTNSSKVAHTLVGHKGNRVFLLGGEMQRDNLGAFGFVAESQAKRYLYDFAILSADALSVKAGFMYMEPAEAELAQVVAERTKTPIVTMVHQKFGTDAPHQGFDPTLVSRLVTDADPGKKLAARLKRWQIGVEVAI